MVTAITIERRGECDVVVDVLRDPRHLRRQEGKRIYVDRHGYGRIWHGPRGRRQQVLVHRLVAQWVHGVIGSAMDVHHSCENKLCVRPEHLVLMTHGAHMREHARLRRERAKTPANRVSPETTERHRIKR